jgi:hypothetical protein
MMKSWTLYTVHRGGGDFLQRWSPVSPCCIRSRRARGHRQGHDLLFSLDGQQCMGDVSVIHSGSVHVLRGCGCTGDGTQRRLPSTEGIVRAATDSCPSKLRPSSDWASP